MLEFFMRLPILRRWIPSIGIRILKLLKKNRGFFKIVNIEFFLDFLDPVDRQIILYKKYEHDQIIFFEDQIKKNPFSYFLDIGANSGYYSFYFAKKFKNLKIKSFEPNKDAFNKLEKTLLKNSFNNIEIFNIGLSDNEQVVKMKSQIKHGAAHTNSSKIDILDKIDYQNFKIFEATFKVGDNFLNLNNQRILIKIDVEGHELNTLKGLTKNLNQNDCLVQIEIGNNKFNDVDNFLKKNNFKQIFKSKYRLDYFYINFNNSIELK